ncbi:GAF domain-containing protein [Candidatus Falkowbacteria bacterium]|nr:GAF domain-containing protein [Candidatus Falkowbacteria bacterium]
MDIRLLVTRSILYFLLIIYVAGLYTFLTFIAGELLVERAGVSSSFIPLFIAFVIVIGLDPLKRILTKYTDKLFYKGRIDYQKVLRHLSEVIALEINLDHLLDSILEILNRELKIKNGVILLADKQGKFFKPESFLDGRKSVILDDKSPLIRYLKKDKNLIITEELIRMTDDAKTPTEKNYLERVRKDLEDLDCALCLPVIIDKKLTSVVIVGPKLSGDMFSFEDVRLFEVLAPQMAAAIEKAKLYEEVQDFSITLQQKVEKATHELQEANIHLRQLDKAKSEFLSIAAHQLRTPISGIKGYLSMLLDGDFGTLDEKKRKVMRTVFNSTERLNRLVNVFLNISRIESGRLKLSPSPVVVEELVESAINNFKIVAQRKKIELEFIKPKKKTKPINIDRDKITDVVNNLIDNSIKYTEKGKIAVQVKQEKGQVMFAVKDTGIGMAEEDLSGMFNKFSRTSASERINTGGSGLGLYIAKRLVEAHGGKIWAKSPGRGQGSTFMFSLPIK